MLTFLLFSRDQTRLLFVCMYTHTYTQNFITHIMCNKILCICMCVRACVGENMHVCACMRMCVHMCMYICMCTGVMDQ